MKRTMNRARVVVGSAVVAVAGFAAAGSLSAAPESAPPSTTPGSSEPLGTASESAPPVLGPEREELVDAIVVSAGDSGFPLDRECVADLVTQIPDEDLVIVGEDIANAQPSLETAVPMPEDTLGSEPADTSSIETIVTETVPMETVTMDSGPAVSPVTEEIGRQMIACAQGDADPALVEDALAVIQADPDAPSFDMACVASVLTTFADETLTLIIEDDDAAPTETAADVEASVETVVPAPASSESVTDPVPTDPVTTEETGLAVEETLSSIPDEAFTEALSLLICAPGLLDEFDTMGSDVATASAPEPVVESAPADTAVDEPTETTTG